MSSVARRSVLAVVLSGAMLVAPSVAAAEETCSKVASPSGSDGAAGTVAAPYRSVQKLSDSLSSGQTGCLRAGTYSSGAYYVLEVRRSQTRLTSYPGERAKLVGRLHLPNGYPGTQIAKLDIEGTAGQNTIELYSPDVTIEQNDITNNQTGRTCLIMGSNAGYGSAVRVIVRQNVFHECGSPSNGNLDHGIYAQNVDGGEIVDNIFYNSASFSIQLYPNSRNTRFAHNVIDGANSVRGGVIFGGDEDHTSVGNIVENNVIAYAATYAIDAWWGGAVGVRNVARDNCVSGGGAAGIARVSGFTAITNLIANPGFVNRAARDYRLTPDSPCLATVGYDTAALIASGGRAVDDASTAVDAPAVDVPTAADTSAPVITSARRARASRRSIALRVRDRNSGVWYVQATTDRGRPGRRIYVAKRSERRPAVRRSIRVSSTSRPVYVRAVDGAGNRSRWHRVRR